MMPMVAVRRCLGIALVSLLTAAPAVFAGETGYAPMKPFEPLTGHVWRGEPDNPDLPADIAKWEFILGGRAVQMTHVLEDGAYGGRSIYFYDQKAGEYLFHYFTTAGFHTRGSVTVGEDGTLTATEKVEGHPQITETRATIRMGEEAYRLESEMLADGDWRPGNRLSYEKAPAESIRFDRLAPMP